jgi:molybdopterin synthase sulfur carrier subunit
MTVEVHIPSALKGLFQTQRIETVEAQTVAEIAAGLNRLYPGILERILEPDGQLRRYVNVFVEGEDGRDQADAGTLVPDGSGVWIVQNVAGG